MKIEINFDTNKEIIMLPTIAIAYDRTLHRIAIVFVFICWAFSIDFGFK